MVVIQELNKSQLTIVLFDLDGTLTRRDTFTDFIQYAVGKPKYYRGLLNMSPALTGYALRLISNHIAKEKLLSYYFKGWEISRFQQIADTYSAERIDELSRPLAVERIRWHQGQGHKVVIVSASLENWIAHWCNKYDLDLIATRIEVRDGKLTGRFLTKYDLSDFQMIYAYGNSRGDTEMLNIANRSYYRLFD